ncbi:MAG: response regulator transcription factor [Lachnospiraceae bacterium]|nr:response regulator transcription factor [Lachnospiraceae bacterium]
MSMINSILIIEDDSALAAGLTRALTYENQIADSCRSIAAARAKLEHTSYDLLLLDINLPDGSGLDFLAELKTAYKVPVILLTANDMETDIVTGLEAGADDYITKPFSLAVLRARVNARLRASVTGNTCNIQPGAAGQSAGHTAAPLCFDDYSFDFERMVFTHAGINVELSKTEQKLLRLLVENAGNTLSRSTLIDRIWTDGAAYVDENALSVTVKRLRDKLSAQNYIKTVYGIGYSWVDPSD